jgi:hypothetical protein
MIIVLNTKKTILVSSLSLCLLTSLYAAYKLYHLNRSQKKKASLKKSKSKNDVHSAASVNSKRTPTTTTKTPNKKIQNQNQKTAKKINFEKQPNETIPAEELLELGLNYLNQAIKSWETALDSIEAAAYMQAQTLALPNDQHAELVFRLRNLLDAASNINLKCTGKLIMPSQTLQIIQSKLAIKQQLYAEALLKANGAGASPKSGSSDLRNGMMTRSESYQIFKTNTPVGGSKMSYFSDGDNDDDDTDSFVSADSDVDWLSEEMLGNIQNFDEKNVLYEMAMSSVKLNASNVIYRVDRTELLMCRSKQDFSAKIHVLRMGFDRLMEDSSRRQWLIGEGKKVLSNLLKRAEKDCSGFHKAFDELVRFVSVEANWKNIKDELATRDVLVLNLYDIALDFILLDAFEDLENPPSPVITVIQNRWLSQSFKETALATAVWSVLKAKRKLLKYPDGFITRFYSITEYLVPVFAWGFFGTNEELKSSCEFLKNHVTEYLRCLFDMNRTRYTNLEEFTSDIEAHTRRYLKEMEENI